MHYNNPNWFNGGDDYPAFQYDNSEQQSNGFDTLGGMDKFLMVMDKVVVPVGNLIPKISDSAAKHREINASQRRNQDLFSVIQQQQDQINQLLLQLQSLQQQQPVQFFTQPQTQPLPMEMYPQQMPYLQFPRYIPQPMYNVQPMFSSQPYNPPLPYNLPPVTSQIPWNEYMTMMFQDDRR